MDFGISYLYLITIQRILSDYMYFYFEDNVSPKDYTPPKTGLQIFVDKKYEVSTDRNRKNREYVLLIICFKLCVCINSYF